MSNGPLLFHLSGMGQPTRIIIPIAEIQFHMTLALATFPRFKLAILASPHSKLKDATREELIATLTKGWEVWRIERALAEHEKSNLPVMLSLGRAALPSDD